MEIESTISDPFEVFVSSMNEEDVQIQINTIQRLSSLAVSLDVERTRNELIPFLNNISEEASFTEDELLFNVAEQLGDFLPFVGGSKHSILLVNVLEKLAIGDEKLVRDAAVNSLKKIILRLENDSVEQVIVPLIFRLADSEWFTSKCSAACLIPECYVKVSEEIKGDLKNLFKLLIQHESPFVRKNATVNFPTLAENFSVDTLKSEFVPILISLSKDDEDLVKIEAIDVDFLLAKKFDEKFIEESLMTTFLDFFTDESWKIRSHAANRFVILAENIGDSLTRKHLIEVFQNLSTDFEPEVRDACAKQLATFCQLLQTKHENPQETNSIILEKLIPITRKLYVDYNSNVRESLAENISKLGEILKKEEIESYLFPIILEALENDSGRNKEFVVTNLNKIVTNVVDTNQTELLEKILNVISDLIITKTSAWRTRRNLLVSLNLLGDLMSKEQFDEKLKSLVLKLLNDKTYAIRRIVPVLMPKLIHRYGFQWTKKSLIPDIVSLAENTNYLYRFVSLFCMEEILEPTLGQKIENYMFSLAPKDECIEIIQKLNSGLENDLNHQWVKDSISFYENNRVPEDNLKMYAENTFDSCQITNVWQVENTSKNDFDKIYIIITLKLSGEIFLKVLRKLSKDKTTNIRIRVGNVLGKIKKFNQRLNNDLKQNFSEILSEIEKNCSDNNLQEDFETKSDSAKEEIELKIEEKQSENDDDDKVLL